MGLHDYYQSTPDLQIHTNQT